MIPCTVHGDNGESEKMVAISIYRGNLHRVPDVPRRWLMPNPQISFKDFKLLLLRRSKALSRLRAPTNPNPSSLSKTRIEPPTANVKFIDNGEGPSRKNEVHIASELVGGSSKKPLDGPASFVDSKTDLPRKASERVNGATGNQIEPIRDKGDLLSDKEKRKREIEDRLQVLNAKKHNLVLVLKQILNAEEELKRQNSMQGTAMRPSVPFQADGTHDTGSMSKHMAPRMGTEANLGDDVEGGATDDLSNHNVHSRHILRTTGMSTSSESPLRRTPSVQQNMVCHPTRASSGATASPSRFALSGHQGNPMNLPSVSVSGTSYIASSPSPAASGGTSVFRDARQPSPWN